MNQTSSYSQQISSTISLVGLLVVFTYCDFWNYHREISLFSFYPK